MAIYRSIHTTFWTDTKIVDDFTPEDKYFMLYCLTNNYTNLCGCYEISIKQMVRDLGYNEETIRNLLKRFQQIHKIIFYNESNKELLIKNWYKYNWTKSDKLDKPLLDEIKSVKTIEFKQFLTDEYNKRDTVSIPYTYPMDTTVSVSNTDNIFNNIYNNNINDKPKKEKRNPTLEEIQEYIQQKQLKVDGKQFFDYFEVGNWTDSNGNKVKNWKQKLLTWNKFNNNTRAKQQKKGFQDYEQRQYNNLDNLYANF